MKCDGALGINKEEEGKVEVMGIQSAMELQHKQRKGSERSYLQHIDKKRRGKGIIAHEK